MNSPRMITPACRQAGKRRGFSRIIFWVWISAATSACGIGCKDSKGASEKYLESLPQIESVVSRLLIRYQVDGKAIRARKVLSGDGKFSRVERRIFVAPEFNTLSFNHDLYQAVSEFGATAIASEKSEDKSVAMHIKKDGVIVETLVFLVKRD